MNTFELIKKQGIVPVIKVDDIDDIVPVVNALQRGGINIAEITFRTECGPEAMARAKQQCSGVLVGAGTVINAAQAELAASLGAEFIVSPGFDKGISDVCIDRHIPYIAGCCTPTEIMCALSHGWTVQKFFPAETFGGVSALKALAPVFANIMFMPTGGINVKNVNDYLALKNVLACGGSWMVSDRLIKEKAYGEIERLAREAMEVIGR